jgi:enediyne biosynthesis protein E4
VSATTHRRGRRLVPALLAATLMVTLFAVARLPGASAEEKSQVTSRYKFTSLPIELPAGLPSKNIRQVNPAYARIQSWLSSVGAGIAVNDLSGTGKPEDLCIVDPRSDRVIVTPAPTSGRRYAPFALNPAPLAYDDHMAPTGCVPGDYNEDGRMDLLTYYLGRTPILYLAKAGVSTLSAAAYTPTEVVPSVPSPDGSYTGPRWQTTAVAVEDFDGDGHVDIVVGNYFPDSDVLDPHGIDNVQMNDSMSRALNAGGAHVLHCAKMTRDGHVIFQEQKNAIPYQYASGWTLGAAGADLDGDMLPELYLANDFGFDRLLHNVSTTGHIQFKLVQNNRTPTTPKSMALGHDSFKGMSVDFQDLRGTGRLDAFVSDITVSWGIEESNLLWINNSKNDADAKATFDAGHAPFTQQAAKYRVAWTGWGWDAKMADFNNSGRLSIVQTDGFVAGTINRWPWLQELAMANDQLVRNPKMWPKAVPGDNIAGYEPLAFYAPSDQGYYINISHDLGIDWPNLGRGVGIADTNGDGRQDMVIARQWEQPVFFRNDAQNAGNFVGLHLYRPVAGDSGTGTQAIGTPAYGAVVKFTTADGRTFLTHVDGGSGHSGKRSFDVSYGLGSANAPVQAEVCWRDLAGQVHKQTLTVTPGWHNLMLGSTAQEVSGK